MSMHADEESDEGVVPMKRSNNEGLSSAETVEGRTSPKGNGGRTVGHSGRFWPSAASLSISAAPRKRRKLDSFDGIDQLEQTEG
jgi:hypothetical protein